MKILTCNCCGEEIKSEKEKALHICKYMEMMMPGRIEYTEDEDEWNRWHDSQFIFEEIEDEIVKRD